MRLLLRSNTGEFSLTKDLVGDDSIPPYAILSHTWGPDEEEVTFDDLTNGTGEEKLGYEKIRFCEEQARLDGLQYFWIDTCCINKKNDTELSRSINSMFRWYRNATRCYVYLSDVSTTSFASNRTKKLTKPWESDFWKSRWFTRGWTLQELLAPASVEFFSKERERLGDKSSLRQQIHEITNISHSALQGCPLSQFSVEERLKWIEHRHTKHEEDKAYSLLGIFDVYILPIYGEGMASALARLLDGFHKMQKCIQDLHLTDPRDDKKRIEDTKGGLLEDSYRWILKNSDFQQWRDNERSRLLWIKGDPGKGKTMLLCGMINELNKSMTKTGQLSYFFCQATDSRINSATAVLRGLLYLLVNQQPSLVSYIRKKHDYAGKALFENANAWVALSEIFTDILQDPSLNSTSFVIDALDECIADLPKLLDFIVQKSCVSSRVKWIVSSRNWPDIEERLERAGHKVRLCLELNAESVSTAVSIFIQHKVLQLADKKKYDDKTRGAVLDHLSMHANDTFLWAALVCQNLEEIPRWNTLAKLNAFPPGLDSLYERMTEQIRNSDNSSLCKQILALIAIVYQPITLTELTSFVEQLEELSDDVESLEEIVGLCGSFLVVRNDTIYFVHQSAKDYLMEKGSAEIFPSAKQEAHYEVFWRSLQVLCKTLRRDIYNIRAPGCLIEQVETPSPDPLATSRYACIYWVHHLSDCNLSATPRADLQEGGIVDDFLKTKYLYWLEALSLCRSMSGGVLSMAKLEALIQGRAEAMGLLELCRDACRFIMYHKPAIETSPLQAYVSALVFSPTKSIIRRHFRKQEPEWFTIMPPMREYWGPCLQTLEGDSDIVSSVAFSHDSTWLASASRDSTVKIWDTSNGECLQTLRGHSDWVFSAVFSHDSTRVASASIDGTVKIWSSSSGDCLKTLMGHNKGIDSVAFSHDSTRLASASRDTTIKIWDSNSGKCLQTLKGHNNTVTSIAFSHESMRLASASQDGTVKIWDTSNCECLQTLEGHKNWTCTVAFSHDSTRLASASMDGTIKIWDPSSGECSQTITGHNEPVGSVVFSHDSTRLASTSQDGTVKIWDTSNGECLQTLDGHNESVNSAVFSHNSTRLASASHDGTIKIWDTSSCESMPIRSDHKGSVNSVAFSHNSTRLVSASRDSTVKIWDTSSGECLRTLEGHNEYVGSAVFSHDSTRLASASYDTTIKIWDPNSNECLQTLNGHNDNVASVAFSHNSTWLVSASYDRIIKIWDTSDGKCLQTLQGHSDYITSVAFSYDSTFLASASMDGRVKVWNPSSGECLQTLKHGSPVTSVAFSHNSNWLASAPWSAAMDGKVKVWNPTSGECLQTVRYTGTGRALHNVAFNPANSCVHTDLETLHIDVLSAPSITPNNAENPNSRYQGAGLGSNGTWITYRSENLLWLPSQYRPSCSVLSEIMIGFGSGSGKVWVCRFDIKDSKIAIGLSRDTIEGWK